MPSVEERLLDLEAQVQQVLNIARRHAVEHTDEGNDPIEQQVVQGHGHDEIRDNDGDTKWQAEESADEDILRADTGGAERATISSAGLAVDKINELVSAAGVTIEGVLLKDNEVTLTNERIQVINATSGSAHFEVFQSGDTFPRLRIRSESGAVGASLSFGPGGGSDVDVILQRSAADVLRTPDSFTVDADLKVSGSLNLDADATLTIVSGDVTATGSYHTIAGEGAADDDLIGINGGVDGDILIIRPSLDSVTITVKHNGSAAAADNILLNGDSDVTLDDEDDTLTLLYDAGLDTNGAWIQTSEGAGGGGGGGHGTGSISGHGDVDAMTEARGDLFHVGTGGSNWGRLAIGSAGAVLGSDGTDPSWTVPKRTITLTAGAGRPSTTSGCATSVTVEAGTNDVDYDVLDFDKDTNESAFWPMFAMPNNWDGGTVTARFYWTAASGSGTFTLGIKGRSYADSDAIDQAYGTEVETTDTLITAGDVHISPESAAITLNGGPAGGELVSFKVTRKTTDTLTVDARLIAIKIIYTLNSVTDA